MSLCCRIVSVRRCTGSTSTWSTSKINI